MKIEHMQIFGFDVAFEGIMADILPDSSALTNEIREFANKIAKETTFNACLIISSGLMYNMKLNEIKEIYNQYGLEALIKTIRNISSSPKL